MGNPTETHLPEPADDVVFSRVSEGAVLLATDTEIYYGLNETGARAWEMLGRCRTVDDLCRQLGDEYADVDPETLRGDVTRLLDDLAGHGLVRTAGGDGDAAGRSEAGG